MTEVQIKAAVRERDGFKCVDCGITNDAYLLTNKRALDVHRLKPRSRYVVEGCVTLCLSCHKKRHGAINRSAAGGPGKHRLVFIAHRNWRAVRVAAALNNMSVPQFLNWLFETHLSETLKLVDEKSHPQT